MRVRAISFHPGVSAGVEHKTEITFHFMTVFAQTYPVNLITTDLQHWQRPAKLRGDSGGRKAKIDSVTVIVQQRDFRNRSLYDVLTGQFVS